MAAVLTPANAAARLTKFAGLAIKPASASVGWGVCMAIYGPGGTGKTTLASTCADSPYGSPVLFVDAEGGARSISHRDDIDVIDLMQWSQLADLRRGVEAGQDFPWRTVVFDNLSEYQSISMKSILGSGADQPSIADWGKNTRQMLDFVRFWRDVARHKGVNVIFIAWDSPEKDEETKITKRAVNFTPALASQFPGIVDIIGYLAIDPTSKTYTRILNFAPSQRTDAKFRRAQNEAAMQIPYAIYNPSMVELLATLKGGEAWPTAKFAAPVATKTSA